jgi:hypothetical protein
MAIDTHELLKIALSRNPNASAIDKDLVARIAAGIDNQITGSDWFSPMTPINPLAPKDVAGRQFDYPVGVNLQLKPRQYEAVSFEQMRALADNYTIMRLAIETRKDQLVKLKWNIKAKDEKKKLSSDDKRKAMLEAFFTLPNKENSWQQWLRALVEDMLVIDASTLYPRMTRGKDLYSLDLMDGATVKRVIDYSGRTPTPPDPAYQQALKGLPAVNYTRDELVYYPRNIRTNKLYGFGPVEQCIMIVNIGLRRDLSMLQYYTEGNIPDAFCFLPPDWQPDQIKQFQIYWDTLIEGDTAARRHMRFMPGGNGAKIEQTRDPKLKDEYDEWLARIICYCFSLPPTPFVKQMNRATSESVQKAALEEGLAPMMQWVADLINYVIVKYFGITDLVFAWIEEETVDPQVRAEIQDKKIRSGEITLDEAREATGKDPYPNGMGSKPLLYTSTGAVRLEDVIEGIPEPVATPPSNGQPSKPGADAIPPQAPPAKKDVKAVEDKKAEKLEKKRKKGMRIIDPARPSALKAVRGLKKTYAKFFKKALPDIAGQLSKNIAKLTKMSESQVKQVLGELSLSGWTVLVNSTIEELEAAYKEAATHAIAQIGSLEIDTDRLTSLVNEAAKKYAENRAAEMVGMKFIDGELVENPNAKWAITDSTRDMLRTSVADAIDNGWSTQHLADELEKTGIFDENRAELIARTEIKNADERGNLETYKASGLDLVKEWQVSADHPDMDECDENEDAGPIDLNDDFPSGDECPGSHPNCMCTMIVTTKDEPIGAA